LLERRTILGMALAWVLMPQRRAAAEVEVKKGTFNVRIALLFGAFHFEQSGNIDESIDHGAGRYEIRITGTGSDMTTEIESTGALHDGRWAPVRFRDHIVVYGRESRLEVDYDLPGGHVHFQGRSETFLLRRVRVTDDTLSVPPGAHVDDVISATLNYVEGRWPAEPDGRFLTQVVRRQKAPGERPDDVGGRYRAELVPLELRVAPDTDGRPTALLDMSRFTSWAREDEPARIVFGANRRPETITASLILGTSLAIKIGPGSLAAL
jgi:hypothetical protein